MNPRWSIPFAALLAVSCTNQNRNSALVITKLVLGTATVTNPGPPPTIVCSYDPSADEFDFAHIDPAANTGGTMGAVVQNNLMNPATLNPLLRADSARFHPHQVVASYEVIGGATVGFQVIPVAGVTVPAGGTGPVLVPFFSPAATATLAGTIRVTFHIEGKLDDGSTVRTSEREYIFVTCTGSGCNSDCL
jgi:hypothetical protein